MRMCYSAHQVAACGLRGSFHYPLHCPGIAKVGLAALTAQHAHTCNRTVMEPMCEQGLCTLIAHTSHHALAAASSPGFDPLTTSHPPPPHMHTCARARAHTHTHMHACAHTHTLSNSAPLITCEQLLSPQLPPPLACCSVTHDVQQIIITVIFKLPGILKKRDVCKKSQ